MRFLPGLTLVLFVLHCAGTTTGSTDGGNASSDAGVEGSFCTIDEECGAAGFRCRGGVCITEECTTREQCFSGRICSSGECVLPSPDADCTDSNECPTPYLCDGFARRCWDPETGEYLGGGTGSSSSTSGQPSSGVGPGSSSMGTSSSSSGGPAMLIDIGGYRIENDENSGEGVIPMGTRVPAGGIVVIARNASKSEFEAHWNVTLGSNVVFLNSNNETSGPPVINGGEKYSLFSRQNMRLDGPTITGTTRKSIRRTGSGDASNSANWVIGEIDSANPGTTQIPPPARGIFISEWGDATDYIFEFIELYVNP